MKILLYDKTVIIKNNDIFIYGYYKNERPTNIFIKCSNNCIKYDIIFYEHRNDFYIKIIFDNEITFNEEYNLVFNFINEIIEFNNIKFEFPFVNFNLNLNNNKSAIICTMCKNYTHRLEEWIKYNLKLGFSGIVIFDNDSNNSNSITESTEYCNNSKSIYEIRDNYKDYVFIINFPYCPISETHWNNVQRMCFTIASNAMKNKCKYIAIIDADEFIYLPKNPNMNIESFLSQYRKGILFYSNILTNKNNNDIIDNNVLNLNLYLGKDHDSKVILNTNYIKENEFLFTPHWHRQVHKLSKDDIIFYHIWLNSRYNYNENMIKINFLQDYIIDNK
jgi:hypothetical protein